MPQVLAGETLQTWLRNQQLNPPSGDDGLPPDAPPHRSRAMEISQKSHRGDPVRKCAPCRQTGAEIQRHARLRRANQKAYQQKLDDLAQRGADPSRCCAIFIPRTSSKEQLNLVLDEFPLQSSASNKNDIRALIGDYEEAAIRPHVLGKFRDLLFATVIHPGHAGIFWTISRTPNGHIN